MTTVYEQIAPPSTTVTVHISQFEMAYALWQIVYDRLPAHTTRPGAQYMTTLDGEVWLTSKGMPSRLLVQDRDIAALVDAYNLLRHGVRLQVVEDVAFWEAVAS